MIDRVTPTLAADLLLGILLLLLLLTPSLSRGKPSRNILWQWINPRLKTFSIFSILLHWTSLRRITSVPESFVSSIRYMLKKQVVLRWIWVLRSLRIGQFHLFRYIVASCTSSFNYYYFFSKYVCVYIHALFLRILRKKNWWNEKRSKYSTRLMWSAAVA